MSSQLQNILSALSQGKKPLQQQGSGVPPSTGGLPNSSRPPSAAQQPNLPGGFSTLSNLRQLIGRSTAGATPASRVPPIGQTSDQTSDVSNNTSIGLAAILRGLPGASTQQQPLQAPSHAPHPVNQPIQGLPPTRPQPSSTVPPQTVTPIRPPQVVTQQQQQTWPPPQQHSSANNGFGTSHHQVQQQPPPQQFARPPPSTTSTTASAATSNQFTTPLPTVPTAVALGIVDSPMAQGSWELNESDIQSLLNAFGQTEWMKVLCSPLGSGRVPDCAIAKFRDPAATRRIESELDGTLFDGMGRLVVSSFPSSMLDGVADEASLAALVSSKVQAKATAPSQATTATLPSSAAPPLADDTAAIAAVLAQALGASDAQALLATEAGRNAVAAVKADPSLISAIQSQVQALQTSSTQPTTTAAPPAAPSQVSKPVDRSKKRVCRLELMDLFGHHPEFDVASLIVGQDNSNIQYVLEEAKQKVDIDLDGVPYNAAPVAERLHLTVTALDEEAYTIAVETLEDLLASICKQFVEFCQKRNLGPCPQTMGFKRHEYTEGADGQLMYLGQKERPKLWLEQQQQQQQQPQIRY